MNGKINRPRRPEPGTPIHHEIGDLRQTSESSVLTRIQSPRVSV